MDVSVIVPVYNVGPYLRECLDSILSQTGVEMEVVCVDDGSTDGSAEILQDIAGGDPRIRVIVQENRGLSAARNRALDVATGKYVCFVDSDDMLAAGALAKLVSIAEKEDLDHIIFGAESFLDERHGAVGRKLLSDTENYYRIKDPSIFHVVCGGAAMFARLVESDSFYVSSPLRLLRKDVVERKRLRFVEGIIHEDNHFTPLALIASKRAVVLPDRLYRRRLRSGSIMSAPNADVRHAAACFCIAARLKDDIGLDTCGCDVMETAIGRYLGFLLEIGWHYLSRSNCEDRIGAVDEEMRRMSAVEQWLPVRRIALPLLQSVEAANARARKYRDKRLSSRLKKLFGRKPAKERCAMEESSPAIKVSVMVPVYNAERYLRQALDSLSAQTLDRVEFICVDDGSRDASGAILDEYAARDGRFRVFHTINRGAVSARNFGMDQARGEYLAFMDADDYVEPGWLEDVYGICRKNELDICISDFQMFSEKTGELLPHWWTLKNQADNLVFNKVISPGRLGRWAVHGNVWSGLFNRRFVEKNGLRFFQIKPADDAHFLYSAMIKAKRMYFHPVVYLHYRRGMETSAIAQHGKNFESQKECLLEIGRLRKSIRSRFFNGKMERAFLWRFLHDVLYAGENIPKMADWLANGGLADCLRIETLRKRDIGKSLLSRVKALAKRSTTSLERPKAVGKLVDDIEAARFGKKKDLYIITGQLNSKTNEPIDSWTFFRHLQDKGVPSRYVIWRKHYFLKEIKRQGLMKDVIVLRGNGVKDFEFLRKCRKELVRAKAVVQENGAIEEFTARWLRELPGCEYVFLQHGVFGMSLGQGVAEWIANAFNTVNVSSERERAFLGKTFSRVCAKGCPRLAIGGLPRWDVLKDVSEGEPEKIVFVMMTWRSTFNAGMDTLKRSDYYRGLRALLSKERLAEMRKMGLRVVWAPHHHMANRIRDLDFGFDDFVEVAKTSEISKWIARSSMCITDFSSVSGDFLFLGKPVVYWVPDRDDPLLDPEEGNAGAKVRSACESLEKWFNVAMSEDEVMEYVRHYGKVGFRLEDEKMEMAGGLFAHKEGICEKIHQALEP